MVSRDKNLSNTYPAKRVVSSLELLRGEKEVWIENEGIYYRLIKTKAGKLILNK